MSCGIPVPEPEFTVLGQQVEGGERGFEGIQRLFEGGKGVDLQIDQAADIIQGVAEDEAGPLQGAEQVAQQGETAIDAGW